MIRIDITGDRPAPKRGDLVNTNVGDRRERTWFVLHSRHMRSPQHPRRYQLKMARWWEIEPEMRLALWRSAERRGGQQAFCFYPYPKKKKLTFEDLMK